MKIQIEEQSGFCFGVGRAIDLAEKSLLKGKTVYCLGEIVHNEKEINRLAGLGMVFINHSDLKNLRDSLLLIRAHGEPPETYQIARRNKLTIIDGTCPIVLSLQKKIRKRFDLSDPEKDQIVIYGKKGHPEVIGLRGQTENQAFVASNPEDLEISRGIRNVYLYSQTTMDTQGFDAIAKRLNFLNYRNELHNLEINNTICRHISHREPGLRRFAREKDILIFVAGLNSSNGRILYEICKGENEFTFLVSEADELKEEWFEGSENIGICGATSSPGWQLEEIAERIRGFTEN